jgi:hypothetical protein
MHIQTASIMKNGSRRAYRSTVAAANAPLPSDHCGFGLDHFQDKTRTDRNASFTGNTILCGHHRWIYLLSHYLGILLLPNRLRKQDGECSIELFKSCNA